MSQHRAARRGGRHAAPRPRPSSSLPVPRAVRAVGLAGTLAGLAVLAVVTSSAPGTPAAGSAAPVGPGAALSSSVTSSGSLGPVGSDGTDAVGYVVGDRGRAVSRDSERQALSDAAAQPVQKAAEDKGAETNAALKSLGRAAEEKAATMATDAWVLPTSGYHLTARFGQAGGRWVNNHTGLDFAAPTGTPIVAVAPGTITQTGWAGAYGNRTVETLEDGTELYYCHQSAIQVKPGQKVTSGQRIGLIGATGNVTGPHLHLEVRPGGGDPVDPFQALVHHGLQP
ncbi:M23 family metallopeptidase [Nocardioides korecus]